MLKSWFLAIRPKTLPAAIAPVMIATAMAYGDGVAHFLAAFCALITALLLQIATNLANDYFDFKNGADVNRVGPTRVSQSGLISPKVVLMAAFITFALALVASAFLIYRGGYGIAIVAVVSILSGLFYTAGPRPLGYLGLGELFVFIFFGPVAVAGAYYVQSLELNWVVVVAGFAPGFISCALIAVNNLRDIDGDRRVNKKTLAVRFGRSFAINEYIFFILAAAFIPVCVQVMTGFRAFILMASVISFLAIPSMRAVATSIDGPVLNNALAKTGRLLIIYAILFSIGWLACSR